MTADAGPAALITQDRPELADVGDSGRLSRRYVGRRIAGRHWWRSTPGGADARAVRPMSCARSTAPSSPVLYGYDRNTYYYDANGRLVPTPVLQGLQDGRA